MRAGKVVCLSDQTAEEEEEEEEEEWEVTRLSGKGKWLLLLLLLLVMVLLRSSMVNFPLATSRANTPTSLTSACVKGALGASLSMLQAAGNMPRLPVSCTSEEHPLTSSTSRLGMRAIESGRLMTL